MTCLINIPQTEAAFKRFIMVKAQERIGKRPICVTGIMKYFPPRDLEHLYEAVQFAIDNTIYHVKYHRRKKYQVR